MKNLVAIKNKHHLKNPLARNCMTPGRMLLISNGIASLELASYTYHKPQLILC